MKIPIVPSHLDRRTARAFEAAVLVAVILASLLWRCSPSTPPSTVHVAAAGDMACASDDPRFADGEGTDGWCRQSAVSDLLVDDELTGGLDAVFGLGDYQYEEARTDDYDTVYDPTWGRVRGITRPALGNQEYKVHDANTFTDYFGGRAPEAATGWYSYDLGTWHVVVLNSNCALIGGCDENSPQVQWLERDLAGDDHACTIAYWHHPRWSTGLNGGDGRTDVLWRTLAEHGADVVLAAHEHDYERFAPLDADGRMAEDGVSSFVVGTGGQAVYGPEDVGDGSDLTDAQRRQGEASQARLDDQHGVLLLTLMDGSFEWRFVGTDGQIKDDGSRTCVQ